jgi:hypothetical protein
VSGQVFTLFYVPVAVTMVAAAIKHIGDVPLQQRERALENFVLAQFGCNLTIGDFEDIRRTAGVSCPGLAAFACAFPKSVCPKTSPDMSMRVCTRRPKTRCNDHLKRLLVSDANSTWPR